MSKIVGQLRDRLTFEADEKTPDGAGGTTSVKVEEFQLWASVRPLSASEIARNGQNQSIANYEIIVHKQSDKLPTRENTILYNGTRLTINGLQESGENWLIIQASKKT